MWEKPAPLSKDPGLSQKVRHDHLQDFSVPLKMKCRCVKRWNRHAVDSSVPVRVGINAFLVPFFFFACEPIIFMPGLSEISNSRWGHQRQVLNSAVKVTQGQESSFWDQPEALSLLCFPVAYRCRAGFSLFHFTCCSPHPIMLGV